MPAPFTVRGELTLAMCTAAEEACPAFLERLTSAERLVAMSAAAACVHALSPRERADLFGRQDAPGGRRAILVTGGD